ncbi:hypothetical protein QUF74_10250 [Candidatus Halobeggiatoa sp. HSG11]|nr:hypothetical protein [Candidatus Halobeggiatoa sp. HSG11]
MDYMENVTEWLRNRIDNIEQEDQIICKLKEQISKASQKVKNAKTKRQNSIAINEQDSAIQKLIQYIISNDSVDSFPKKIKENRKEKYNDKRINVKILQKGDSIINVFSQDNQVSIAIKHDNEEVDIFRLEPDSDGLPRINQQKTWTISFGDGEVDIKSKKDDIQVTTF